MRLLALFGLLVGIASAAPFVSVGMTPYAANTIIGASGVTVAGQLIYGGIADVQNQAWRGKVVLVDRGTNSFVEKVRNVQLSGGIACIVANVGAGSTIFQLGPGITSTLPAVSVSQNDGAVIRNAGNALVTVGLAPSPVPVDPTPQTVPAGAKIELTATAIGVGPFSFQWSKNGAPIPGATEGTFTMSAAVKADSGAYSCRVTNAEQSIVNGPYNITVP